MPGTHIEAFCHQLCWQTWTVSALWARNSTMPEWILTGIAYEPAVNASGNDLIENGKSFCKEHVIQLTNRLSNVPNFHTRGKLHKEPVGFRLVGGSPYTPLTSESKWSVKWNPNIKSQCQMLMNSKHELLMVLQILHTKYILYIGCPGSSTNLKK